MVYIGELWVECPLKPVFIFLVQAGDSCQWVDDSQRLLLEHFDTIQKSPSQIYHSLQFSPPSSWLHKYHGAELSGVVKVIKGLPAKWGICSRTVILASPLRAVACCKDTLAAGSFSGSIIILNTITGSQMAILSGHIHMVNSLAFSSDGTLLVSGMHTYSVVSVSISADCTMITSSDDKTICLWDIQTGECHYDTDMERGCNAVFSPTSPKLIFGSTMQDWDIEGYQVGYADGHNATFSSDGTHFISHGKDVVIVQNSVSRATVAKCEVPTTVDFITCCCLSPNGSVMAVAVASTIYIWDITGSDPLLIETIIPDSRSTVLLTFSSPATLISASDDGSVKFWRIGIPINPAAGDPQYTLPHSASVKSVNMQAENGIAISRDANGVVRVWDISTGLCNASFKTPATSTFSGDMQMIDGRLIVAWINPESIEIWDASEGKCLRSVIANWRRSGSPRMVISWNVIWDRSGGLRISGDGSKIFCLIKDHNLLQAWSIQTGEALGGVEVEDGSYLGHYCMDGSKIWVNCRGKPTQGWDFRVSGTSPVLLSNTPSERSHLHLIHNFRAPPRIEDTVTGKVVFWFSGRYVEPSDVRWDGQYLIAGYESGEVLILDLRHMCPE
jgi:WD40 repeat protein